MWRALKYVAYRLIRLPGTPYSIAAGLAAGAAVSFTPFLGLHFVIGALLALASRGNVVAALIGTFVGNPWTFPLIWALIYSLGRWFLGFDPDASPPQGLSLSLLLEHPRQVLYPMVLGAIPASTVVWILVFAPSYLLVGRYQALRDARRQRGRRRRDKKNARRDGRYLAKAEEGGGGV